MRHYKITGFSDEITPDIDGQLRWLQRLGINYVELRGVDGRNVSDLSPDQARDLRKKLDGAGIQVSSIGSPIGKIPIAEPFGPHFKLFQNTLQLADILGARYIRMFSFFTGERPEECRDEVFARLNDMIDCAREKDVVLLHENEKDIYGDTADRCQDLMENLFCDHFQAVFDFANFVQCGQDTLRAYTLLAPYVRYVHVKDALGPQVVPAGMGQGHVPALLGKILQSGYDGFLSLEPHLADFSGFSALENGREKSEKMNDGAFAWQVALSALKGILYDLEGAV